MQMHDPQRVQASHSPVHVSPQAMSMNSAVGMPSPLPVGGPRTQLIAPASPFGSAQPRLHPDPHAHARAPAQAQAQAQAQAAGGSGVTLQPLYAGGNMAQVRMSADAKFGQTMQQHYYQPPPHASRGDPGKVQIGSSNFSQQLEPQQSYYANPALLPLMLNMTVSGSSIYPQGMAMQSATQTSQQPGLHHGAPQQMQSMQGSIQSTQTDLQASTNIGNGSVASNSLWTSSPAINNRHSTLVQVINGNSQKLQHLGYQAKQYHESGQAMHGQQQSFHVPVQGLQQTSQQQTWHQLAHSGSNKQPMAQNVMTRQPFTQNSGHMTGHQQEPAQAQQGLLLQGKDMQESQLLQQHRNSQDQYTAGRAHSQPWHNSAADPAVRSQLKDSIIQVLMQKKPAPALAWQEKLPRMAERLEQTLYHEANSLEEYADQSTLKKRLHALAHAMNRAAAPAANIRTPFAVNPTRQSNGRNIRMLNTGPSTPLVQIQPQPARIGTAAVHPDQGTVSAMQETPESRAMKSSDPNTQLRPQPSPVLTPSTSHTDQQQNGGHTAPIPHFIPEASQQPANRNATGFPLNSHRCEAVSAEDNHKMEMLKQQQTRLLLLRHASKCPYEGKCPVTELCPNMKQLWKHITQCKDQQCKIPHCVSSRFVLAHYSKCKEPQCPVCGPVVEVIRQNYERNQTLVSATPSSNAEAISAKSSSNSYAKQPQLQGLPQQQRESKPAVVVNAEFQVLAPSPTLHHNLAHGSSMITITPEIVTPNRGDGPPSIKELDKISCSVYSFSEQNIQGHLESITEGLYTTSSTVKQLLLPIIEDILKQPGGYIFANPVDPVALGIPDYPEIIKTPMDLGTVKKKLDASGYRSLDTVQTDVHLTFNNAMLYNPSNTDVHAIAKQFKKYWDRKYQMVLQDQCNEHERNRQNESRCPVCGFGTLKYEPPVFYCNGSRCNGQRIRRNLFYHTGGGNQYHWCQACFQELRDNQPIHLRADLQLQKRDLVKKKHDEEQEESWVQCDVCTRWVHQVCGLFNGRRNISESVAYVCPLCILKKRKAGEQLRMRSTFLGANDLAHTALSTFIEKRVTERLERELLHVSVKENKPPEQVSPLFIRQMSCIDKLQLVSPAMYERYRHKNYPAEFPCRVKCLVLFQKIDGQDVILFGMYVYEYGHKCPQPNQRRVYISYLDSVHYFRPRQYRTIVYHEILLSYLAYVKARGFHTAHIWACPPAKGDDYIFHSHPQDQKTPKDDRLRQWYQDLLEEARQRNIVTELTNLHDEFLAHTIKDATALPYFEGDYIAMEADNIIKNLNQPENEDNDATEQIASTQQKGEQSKSKRKTKSKRARPQPRMHSWQGGESEDVVVTKLAAIIEPMKNSFFVARLHPKEFAVNMAQRREAELHYEQDKQAAVKSRTTSVPVETEICNKKQRLQTSDALHSDNQTNDLSSSNKLAQIVAMTNLAPEEDQTVTKKQRLQSPESTSFDTHTNNETLSKKQRILTVSVSDGVGRISATSPNLSYQTNTDTQPSHHTFFHVVPVPDQTMCYMREESGGSDSRDALVSFSEQSSFSTPMAHTTQLPADGINSAASEPAPYGYARILSTQPHASISGLAQLNDETTPEPTQVTNSVVVLEAGSQGIRPAKCKDPASMAPLTDETEDVDDVMESEFFDTRQAFLNLCQGNHYQFDLLRRAKHSSMMVLYHVHNPDAPKFINNCQSCHTEILSGVRYHCAICGDWNICANCYRKQSFNHPHPLRAIAIENTATVTPPTEEQRRNRRKTIENHVKLLAHASQCKYVECRIPNCSKMKEIFKHVDICKIKSRGGCTRCRRISNLLAIHSRSCRREVCPVPSCKELKERFRQLALQQKQMDDRRRTKMNDMFRTQNAASQSSKKES